MRVIQLERASFTYPGAERPALDGVTSLVGPGIVTLVTGPLGSGCSTLLLVAGGLAPHVTGGRRTGKVTTLGLDPAAATGRRALAGKVGLLLPTPWTQLSGLGFTVEEEVAFGPANLGRSRERIAESVDRAMRLAGVTHLARRDPLTLSGGELQRVMIAGVLAIEPQVYLLDEPAMELDPAGAAALYRLLPELSSRATVLVATTDLDRAVEIAGRILLLRDGRCIADGVPDDVLTTDEVVSARSSTTVASIARQAGLAAPYPLSVAGVLRRIAP